MGGSSLNPLVSIIIPVFNGEKTIVRAITSCLEQSYKNFEILIIDNCSNDNTSKLVQEFSDKQVNYIYTKDKGRALARNIGLNKAKGSYIQFLDADDSLEKDKLKVSVNYLEKDRTSQAYSTGIEYRNTDNQQLKVVYPKSHYEDELLAHNIFPIHSLVFRATNASIFPEELDYCEDWLFWVRTLLGSKIYFNDNYIGGTVYIHGENTMAQSNLMREYELYVQQRLKGEYKPSNLNLALKKNEISLLIIHYFNKKKLNLTKKCVSKNSKYTYLVVKVICNIPFLKKKLVKKVNSILAKDVYTGEEIK